MRMFLLCVLLFLPLTVNANCSDYHGQADECKDTEGCYYKANSGECIPCPANSNVNGTGYYCPQNGMCDNGEQSVDGRCQCESPFNLSLLGTSNIYDCYAPCAPDSDDYENTNSCGLRYIDYYNAPNAPAVVCETNNGLEENSAYHIEPLGVDTYGCYKNNRECNRFSAIDHDDESLPNGGTLEGTATWEPHYNDDNGGYNISNCRYKTTDEILYNCVATIYYHPYSMQYVATAQDFIRFRTEGGEADSNNQTYYCTQCANGPYYPEVRTAYNNPGPCVPPPSSHYQVCKCKPIPQGYYSVGTQWTYASQVGQPNSYYTACPAGKTTLNDIGGTSSVDCTYTPDTKFCDANGCFKITDADSWNWSD